jgi:preprotein translocase subunit SecE
MTTVETVQSRFDTVKLLLAGLIMVAGVVAFYYYAEAYALPYRVLGLLAVTALVLVIVYNTAQGKTLWLYAQDARTELRKVVWPTRTETMQMTVVVSLVVVFVGVALWGMDIFFGWAIQQLLSL